MNKIHLVPLLLVLIAGISLAQQNPKSPILEQAGQRNVCWNAASGGHDPSGCGDGGRNLIWSNFPVTGWFGVDTGYIYLDWGNLLPPPTGLADELIDGFTFAYGTNDHSPAGIDWAVYWFDSCTGWGNIGIQEAGFLFSGLPNGYGLPTLPPGQGWVWNVLVDLQGTGYEFLLGQNFGQGMQLLSSSPTTGPALGSFNGHTQNAFDVYYPNGVYNGTFWFGTTVWSTFAKELYGPQAPAAGMTYYGLWRQGNDSFLYTTGAWALNDSVRFYLKPDSINDDPGWLAASLTAMDRYYPSPYDVTRLVGSFAGGTPYAMHDVFTGAFFTYDLAVPPQAVNWIVYFQGVVGDSPISQPPVDLSNGVKS